MPHDFSPSLTRFFFFFFFLKRCSQILVGLPLPWLLYATINGKPVTVDACSIFVSILVLVGMITLVIGTIHFQGWRLTPTLAKVMFTGYFLFVAQDLLFQWFNCGTCFGGTCVAAFE